MQAAPTSEDARGQGAPGGEAGAVPLIKRGILILRGCKRRQKEESSGLAGRRSVRQQSRAEQCVPARTLTLPQNHAARVQNGIPERRGSSAARSVAFTADACCGTAAPRPAPGGTDCTQAAPWLQGGMEQRQKAHTVRDAFRSPLLPSRCNRLAQVPACSRGPEVGSSKPSRPAGSVNQRLTSAGAAAVACSCRQLLVPATAAARCRLLLLAQPHLGLQG